MMRHGVTLGLLLVVFSCAGPRGATRTSSRESAKVASEASEDRPAGADSAPRAKPAPAPASLSPEEDRAPAEDAVYKEKDVLRYDDDRVEFVMTTDPKPDRQPGCPCAVDAFGRKLIDRVVMGPRGGGEGWGPIDGVLPRSQRRAVGEDEGEAETHAGYVRRVPGGARPHGPGGSG